MFRRFMTKMFAPNRHFASPTLPFAKNRHIKNAVINTFLAKESIIL